MLEVALTVDFVSAEYLKKLRGTDNLWEVRVRHGGNAYRLLSFLDGARLIVVLSAFAKKTERVPPLEIELAYQRRRDYLDRKKQHG